MNNRTPIFALWLCLSVALRSAEPEKAPPFVSMLMLLTQPTAFDKMQVTVSGWLYLQRDNEALTGVWLFPTPDHIRVDDFPSSVIIEPRSFALALKQTYPDVMESRLHGAYVVLTARFSSKVLTKPRNLGCGDLVDVVSVTALRDLPLGK